DKNKRELNLYDTVGLELGSDLNEEILKKIGLELKIIAESEEKKDASVVVFCVNSGSSRFETYEEELIKEITYEYEIPFIIAITQSNRYEECELVKEIEKNFVGATTVQVLA
ncbi:MAG: hypothetical protein ACK5LY_07345, partial [Lachnospirales bacterium]